jgi:hypothetical protein
MMRRRGIIFLSVVMLMVPVVSCTNIPAIQVSDTPTTLPSATATRKPSPTFKPTRTITPTWTPSLTPSPLPTELSGIIEQYDCFPYYGKSPSGEWLFFRCNYFNTTGFGTSLVLYNQITGRSWEYKYCKFYFGCESPDHNPTGSISPLAWSSDGRFLYAIMSRGGDSSIWFHVAYKLLSINLNSGNASVYVDAVAEYSFSPDGKQLAYITWYWDKPLELIVRDLDNSSDFKIILEPKYRQAGEITWSPDKSQFVFVALTSEDGNYPPFSLIQVDVTNHNRELLINDYPDIIYSINWRSDGVLELLDDHDKPVFFFEIANRQITALPTRTPTSPFFIRDPITPKNTD